jgi:trehalose synthase
VTEALWKGTPVVAGNVGGIRLQVMDGVGGFRVDSIAECAAKVDYLLSHEQDRVALGESGRENVRSNFLLPRLLRDELALIRRLVNP